MMPDESGPSRTSDSSSDDRRRVAMVFGCFAMVAFAIIVISIVQLWMLAPERDVDVAEPPGAATPDNSLERLVDSEEWILARSAELSKLNQSCLKLRIPDHTGPALFAEQVEVRDLEPIDASLTTAQPSRLALKQQLSQSSPVEIG